MPQALPFIALAMSAAGTAVTVAGSLKKASYERAVADQNARVADQNATSAALRGMADREQLTMQGSQVISRQRAGAGASGADVQSGSIVDVISSTRMASKLDLLRSEYNTEMEKRGYAVQGSNFRAQGELASLAGAYSAASAGLAGAGQMAGIAYGMKGSSLWGSGAQGTGVNTNTDGMILSSPWADGRASYPSGFPVFGGSR